MIVVDEYGCLGGYIEEYLSPYSHHYNYTRHHQRAYQALHLERRSFFEWQSWSLRQLKIVGRSKNARHLYGI